MIDATLPPHSITANAKPRPAEKTLVTAAVHTEGCTSTIAKAAGNHSNRHILISGPANPKSAVAIHMAMIAKIPNLRGPNLSTANPVKGAKIAPAKAAILCPDMICARDQPNSACRGSMKILLE